MQRRGLEPQGRVRHLAYRLSLPAVANSLDRCSECGSTRGVRRAGRHLISGVREAAPALQAGPIACSCGEAEHSFIDAVARRPASALSPGAAADAADPGGAAAS